MKKSSENVFVVQNFALPLYSLSTSNAFASRQQDDP